MWIHEHKDWPKFCWDSETIVPKLDELHNAIANWRQSNESVRSLKLIHGLKEEDDLNQFSETVIKTSNIEGEFPDEREVRNSIYRRLFSRKTATGSVNGLVDLVLDANWNYKDPLTKKRINEWHQWLFPTGYSGLLKIRTGGWRWPSPNPMRIVTENSSWDRRGEIVHYEAPSGERLEKEMDAYLDWLENEKLDLLLKAGVSHIWFEYIHPYEDGNGRIGRAICDLMLARAGNSDEPFHNMTGQIAAEVQNYYKLLDSHGKATSVRDPMDITEWLVWFLDCLARSMDSAQEILKKTENKMRILLLIQKFNLNDRQKQVILRMLEPEWVGHMTLSKFVTIGKCGSETTASRDIAKLKEHGIFIANPGKGRSTSYRLIAWSDIKDWETSMKQQRGNSLSLKIAGKTEKEQDIDKENDQLNKISQIMLHGK